MARISRRNLLAKTSAGAAAGMVLAAPALAIAKRHATVAAPTTSAKKLAAPNEVPSVAYVRDAAKGEVVLMVGSREIVRTDPALVAYLGHCVDNTTA